MNLCPYTYVCQHLQAQRHASTSHTPKEQDCSTGLSALEAKVIIFSQLPWNWDIAAPMVEALCVTSVGLAV